MPGKQAPANNHSETHSARLPYLPGLDGLRALAVIAVLFYHAGMAWMPGGFLGVEIFFVVSGYLITSLLLAEWDQSQSINLKAFWLRRARRLLPALYLLLLATLVFAVLFLPQEVVGLRNDAAAAFTYVSNWYLILSQKSYFETVGRPPLLRHLWSLAVEEQFYVLWPLLFTAGMRSLRKHRMLFAVLAVAALSTLLRSRLYLPDIDPSRVYYGTDTRAAGILAGVALAYLWTPGRPCGRLNKLQLDLIGLAGLATLILSCVYIDEFQPFLYRYGFTLVSLATLVVIAMVVHPLSRLGSEWLGCRPLRWIGLRSYGIYLWHWPIFVVTRPELDVPIDGLPLLILRLAATLALTELSYRYVETPIRTGALGRLLQDARKAWSEATGKKRRQLAWHWGGVMAGMLVFCTVLGESVVTANPPSTPAYLAMQSVNTIGVLDTSTPTVTIAAQPTTTLPPSSTSTANLVWKTFSLLPPAPTRLVLPTVTAEATVTAQALVTVTAQLLLASEEQKPVSPTTATATVPAPPPTLTMTPPSSPSPTATGMMVAASVPGPTDTPTPTATPVRKHHVTAIGDSVMVSAAGELEKSLGDIEIDAALGRQVWNTADMLKTRRDAGQLGSVVVIHLGNNGVFGVKYFDDIMQALSEVPKVVFVNVKVPRQWEGSNNAMLADNVKRYPKAVLVDWHGVSSKHPEYFWDDGIHVRPEGARAYADLIVTALK